MTQPSTPSTQPSKPSLRPPVDVLESGSEFLLVADLPGVGKDGLSIVVEDGELALSAEAQQVVYARRFALADSVDVDVIEAKLEHGELRVRLPKRSEAQVRKITVH